MEQNILLIRDCFDAARITGERYQALVGAGIRFDDMLYGFTSASPLVPGWKPGTEFQHTGKNASEYPAATLIGDLVSSMPVTVEYNTYGTWHFYVVRKRA